MIHFHIGTPDKYLMVSNEGPAVDPSPHPDCTDLFYAMLRDVVVEGC